MKTPPPTLPTEEEFVITGKEMAKIALKMYEMWEEQMRAPVFAITPFKEWLEKLIKL